jgi:glycosyltransferase involved in cell wall biosynthesis
VNERTPRIDLIWLAEDGEPPKWGLGRVWVAPPTPAEVSHIIDQQLGATDADAWLFWDASLDIPDPVAIERALDLPGDLWHAGLRLGQAGRPELIDFATPTWPLNCDPNPNIEATSWRVSLRACLVRTEVLRALGGPNAEYPTLEGAALEWGHRYTMFGCLTRHVPWLVPTEPRSWPIAVEDSVRFLLDRCGGFWTRYALVRAWMTGLLTFSECRHWQRQLQTLSQTPEPLPYHRALSTDIPPNLKVSVIIPTIERYPYLRTVLDQLRRQTVAPHEVFVIDQTPLSERDSRIGEDFADLPLQYVTLESAGQSTARNAALQQAAGDYFLFIDDDDEVETDLIERHLRSLRLHEADASCGVVDEVGAAPVPDHFRRVRASDVFPTCNTLVKRSAFEKSGLFDLAYDRGQRADGDLGMRVYLSGKLMVLNGDISALHHHAPRGGLRVHKARVVTYSSSRRVLLHRQIPSVSQIYMWKRYFSARQVREELVQAALGTLVGVGSKGFRVAKAVTGLILMPNTIYRIRKNAKLAQVMLQNYPVIPSLGDPVGGEQTQSRETVASR